jgi:hypothetical protein
MSTNAKRDTDTSSGMLSKFDVQVCSKDGRLLREYTLNRRDDGVCTLSDAESCACKNLSDDHGDPLIVIVSEETLLKMRQVQTDCQSEKNGLDEN